MTTKNRGFIALVSALIISTLLVATLLAGSEPVFQYSQTVDIKMRALRQWVIEKETEDFHLFFN